VKKLREIFKKALIFKVFSSKLCTSKHQEEPTMTREQILRDRLEMAKHNLYCYAANYLGTIPKEGFEAEYKQATAEVKMLETWLKEFHLNTCRDSTLEFVGHITTTSCCNTYDGKPMADYIEFEVDTGAHYLDGDRRMFHVGQEVQDWFIGDQNRCGRYDIEKDRRESRSIKITVDKIGYIRSMEWAVEE
jgi:hypothetical protein